MSDSTHEWLIDQNRARYAVDPYAFQDEPSEQEDQPVADEPPPPPPPPPPRAAKKPKRRDPDDVDMRATDV